jgi:hypothetical protein
MPSYTFLNTNTNEVEEHYFGISHYDEFVKNNPHLERYHEPGQGPALGDPVRLGVRTVDNGFREVLSKIHASQPKSNLADKLSRR